MRYANLVELHRRQAERLGPNSALRYKRHGLYHDLSWQQYRADTLACAASLIDAGVKPGDRVGLFAENRFEWLIADLAILTAAAVNVTPHAPLTARQVHYELQDAGVSWLFVSTRAQFDKVQEVRAELPALRGVVSFERLADVPAAVVESWSSFLQRGRRRMPELREELERREASLNHDSLATIMYTSGTTGHPKGVMLTHGNLLSNTMAMVEAQRNTPSDIILSWLPFSHIYARTVDHYRGLAYGLALNLAESAETLVENLGEIRPTHMNAVPRFYEKVFTAVASRDPKETSRKLRDLFGGRIDVLSSGGAPLAPPVAQAYRDAGLLVLQGYGLTESAPVITFNRKDCYKIESVGRPIPGVEVKIAPDGEILTRGPHVMKGYWNKPEATAETIKDGWLYTGDLGRLDDDGYLYITGRKKELLVMSSGKKVVPAYLEGLLIADPCIDQAVVCGEGKSYLTALIVPAWDNLKPMLKGEGVDVTEDVELLAREPATHRLLERRLLMALKNQASYEQVKKFVVLPRPFTVAAEELTVSLKLRRNVVLAKHRDKMDALYRE